mgnify:CR=1 FL=1
MLVGHVEEAAVGAIDQPRVIGAESVLVESELVHGAGTKVFDDYICRLHKQTRHGLALDRLQDDTSTPLVEVVHCEVTGTRSAESARLVAG